jgi:hypothetical protein
MLQAIHKRELVQLCASAILLLPLLAATYYIAFLLRFAGEPNVRAVEMYLATVSWVTLLKLGAFAWFRLRVGWTWHVDFHDLFALAQAVTCGLLAVTLFDTMFMPSSSIGVRRCWSSAPPERCRNCCAAEAGSGRRAARRR